MYTIKYLESLCYLVISIQRSQEMVFLQELIWFVWHLVAIMFKSVLELILVR